MAKGIDISEFQGDVNFDVLKNEIDFVFIRSSFGVGYIDAKFERNKNEARRVNLIRGFYHYSYPQYNTPESEAEYFMSVLPDIQKDELMVLDFEENWNGDRVDWCFRFLTTIKNKLGFKPLIYINLNFANSSNWSKVINGDFGLWLAVWDGSNSFTPATQWPFVAFKQYSATGRVNGINGNVDLDVFFGDAELIKKYGYQPVIVTPPIDPPKPPKIDINLPISKPEETPAFTIRRGKSIAEIFKDFLDWVNKVLKSKKPL